MASFPGRKKNARREDNDIKTEPLRIKTPLHSLQGRFALDSDLKTDSCNLRKRCISLVIKPEREDLCDSNILSILVHLNSGSTRGRSYVMSLTYKVVITDEALSDLRRCLGYLINVKKNTQAASNLLDDYEAAVALLSVSAGSLQLCESPNVNHPTHSF